MKVITVLLAIVTSVAAKEMMGFAHVFLNDGLNYSPAGTVILTQSSPSEAVRIRGFVETLTPALYAITVHDSIQFTDDCNSLGPIREISSGNLFFVVFTNVTTKEFSTLDGYSLSATLEPDRMNSISGRAIAFYNAALINPFDRKPIIRSAACGEVLVLQ